MSQAPIARRIAHFHECHGHRREDPYHWLRSDGRDDPEVLAHLQAENAHAEAVLAPNQALEEALFAEMTGRIQPEDCSLSWPDHGWQLRSRTLAGREYPLYEGRRSQDQDWRLLLDGNVLAGDAGYFAFGDLAVSPDGRWLAYSTDHNGDRTHKVQVLDLDSGQLLEEDFPLISGELIWGQDSRTLYYLTLTSDSLLPHRLIRHRLGQGGQCLYEEKDDSFWLGIGESRDRQQLLLSASATLTTEVLLLPLDGSEDLPRPFWPREEGHEYHLDCLHGRYWLLSNSTGPNFALLSGTGPDQLELVQAHDEEVLLEDMDIFPGFVALAERHNGQARIRIIEGGDSRLLSWPDPVHDVWLGHYPGDELRLGYQSPIRPVSVYRYEPAFEELSLLKTQQIPGGFEPELYQVERIQVRARDGAQVPVTLVWRKDAFHKGENALLIDGYGAYGYSLDPGFSLSRISLLDRGLVYAMAHIRGGQEKGRAWYEGGRGLHKWHSFHDFIDVTRALVARGHGHKDKVCCEGRSAGGLLIGAVLNEAPELYRAALVEVPFVDVISTMLDDSLPLTTGEYDEWGNPNQPRDYHLMLSYSPYDNVRAQAYPHIYVRSGLHDTQVAYWEPAKWVARLRELKTDDNQLLLETDLEVGHGGQSGRYRQYREVARQYAFLLRMLAKD
ncbi:S9 family peptidase [Gallaecimonas sp. GXIMD4217]|uniref:S9 family peptidase n=1 Tax=Gallaecimonas sp. GXIMD4217 TaxID=3131927 RepID=UPI00311AC251